MWWGEAVLQHPWTRWRSLFLRHPLFCRWAASVTAALHNVWGGVGNRLGQGSSLGNHEEQEPRPAAARSLRQDAQLAAKAPQSPAISLRQAQEGPQAACSRGKRARASSLARPYVIVLMVEPGDAFSQLLKIWQETCDEQVHRDCFQRHGTQS